MIRLEVGKSYKTRGGNKVTVLKEFDYRFYTYNFYTDNCEYYAPDGRWYYRHEEDERDLIAEWEDEVPEVDLTKITTPFGLLDKDTQERLKAHGGPYECFTGSKWEDYSNRIEMSLPHWTWRVKPKPFVEYKSTYKQSQYTNHYYTITEKFVDGKYDSYTVDMVPF